MSTLRGQAGGGGARGPRAPRRRRRPAPPPFPALGGRPRRRKPSPPARRAQLGNSRPAITQGIVLHVLDLAFDRLDAQCTRGATGDTRGYAWTKFDGATALHIAAAQRDGDLAARLLDRGVRLDCRACGSFFAPGGPCYYG
eukprot:gene631-1559_t